MQAWMRSRRSQSKEAPWQLSIPQNLIPQNSDALCQRRTLRGSWCLILHASHLKGTQEARWQRQGENAPRRAREHRSTDNKHICLRPTQTGTDSWRSRPCTCESKWASPFSWKTKFPSLSCSDASVRCLFSNHYNNLGNNSLHVPQHWLPCLHD